MYTPASHLNAARAVNYLHGFTPQITHNDLKSPNILVGNDHTGKIADFGLSSQVLKVAKKKGGETETRTSSARSPIWAAPECFTGSELSPSVDVFAFGVVIWECLTRLLPYRGMPQESIPVQVVLQGLRPQASQTLQQQH